MNLVCSWEVEPGEIQFSAAKLVETLSRAPLFMSAPWTNPKNHPLQNYYWSTSLQKHKSIDFSSIFIPSTSHRETSLRICLCICKKINKCRIKDSVRTDVTTNQTKHYKLCHLSPLALHKAKQLCHSPLLGILLRCSFLHEWKQRALWFSWSALLLINRGVRDTRGNRVAGFIGHTTT